MGTWCFYCLNFEIIVCRFRHESLKLPDCKNQVLM